MRKLPDIKHQNATNITHPNTSVMGKPTPHESARLHLTGKALYIDDIAAPEGCLHAYVGMANVACGRNIIFGAFTHFLHRYLLTTKGQWQYDTVNKFTNL